MRALPLFVLLSCAALAQVRVRIWQPPGIEQQPLKEPIRFWELIELRPTTTTSSTAKPATAITTSSSSSRHYRDTSRTTSSTTTTSTTTTTTSSSTTTTTTTEPSTVQWEPQTTVNTCGETDPTALIETLKDSGIYNEIYMAPDIFTASKNFPDLGGRNFMKAKSRYHCDEKCERRFTFLLRRLRDSSLHDRADESHKGSSKLVRFVMTGEDTLEPPKESERAWWDEEEWKREERSILSADASRHDRRKELEKTVRTALRELDRMDHEDGVEGSSIDPPEQEEFDQFFTSDLHSDFVFSARQRRRSSPMPLTTENSGTAQDILGTTIALECRSKRDDLQSGYQLCSMCRAVRHLPKTYFPRILNEVICGESACVKGDGRCAQRFLPLKMVIEYFLMYVTQDVHQLRCGYTLRNCDGANRTITKSFDRCVSNCKKIAKYS